MLLPTHTSKFKSNGKTRLLKKKKKVNTCDQFYRIDIDLPDKPRLLRFEALAVHNQRQMKANTKQVGIKRSKLQPINK